MKRIPNWLIIILLIGILIAIKFLFFAKTEEKGGGAKQKEQPPVSANYYVVKTESITNSIYAGGTAGAFNDVDLSGEISGKIVAIYFKEGDNVNAGASIIKINDAELQAQVSKNKAQTKLAEQQLERLKKLLEIKGVSQEEFDIKETEVQSLKADLQLLQAQIAKTNVVAPFNGTIGLKNISLGSFVSPNQKIASLTQTKPIYIEFAIPEANVGLLKKGDKISFAVKGDKMLSATIYAFESKIDESTKTLKARAIYEGEEIIFPGAFVKVFLDLNDGANSIMLPTQCIIPILKGQKVIVCKNGMAEDRPVTTGIRNDQNIQIVDGLTPGDTVLTTGLLAVKKDSKIKLIKQDK